MISFACKTIEIKDLLMCSFEMNKTDYKLFIFLLTQNHFLSTNDIAIQVDLDRTSVQKSIKRLVEKDIVLRQQQNIETGGYLFVYKIKDKPLIKKKVLDMIKNWNIKVKAEIDKW